MRVATWNLWWRHGPWRERAAAIASTLRALGADVIALQEVWSEAGETFADRLAADLGMHAAFAPGEPPPRWRAQPGVGTGTAVLSRWPLAGHVALELPDAELPSLGALVQTPDGPLPVFSVHLDADPAGSALRARQVAVLACAVAGQRERGLPPLAMGDFNAEPDSDEIRLFEGHRTAPPVPGHVVVDAWRFAAVPQPGATWDRANPHVAALPYPSARIDYVFAALRPDHPCRVRAAQRFGAAPVRGVWPSDHCGVVVDLLTRAP